MDEQADEHALLRDASKAGRAAALLNDPLLIESFAALEAAYLKAWRNTGITEADTIARERLFTAVNIIGKVQEHLHRVIDGGKIAKVQLDHIEGRRRIKAA